MLKAEYEFSVSVVTRVYSVLAEGVPRQLRRIHTQNNANHTNYGVQISVKRQPMRICRPRHRKPAPPGIILYIFYLGKNFHPYNSIRSTPSLLRRPRLFFIGCDPPLNPFHASTPFFSHANKPYPKLHTPLKISHSIVRFPMQILACQKHANRLLLLIIRKLCFLQTNTVPASFVYNYVSSLFLKTKFIKYIQSNLYSSRDNKLLI